MVDSNLISKIEVVSIRDAFPHEALDFTVWLEDNIDVLAERIGRELNVLEREKAVGSFNVDLFCEDEDGHYVIIENQLERSDHDHLGKLLTYMVNLEAKTAIWIVTLARQEHERVVDWLNEVTGSDMAFYLVQLEAIRIADSPYAPLFTVLARPDEQTREIGEQKKELADRHVQRYQFWSELIERSRDRTRLLANRSPSKDHWLGIGAGKTGVALNFLIMRDSAGIDLNIDVGDQQTNKDIFDFLYDDREAIESAFGEPLDWRRMDDKRSSRVVRVYRGKGSLNEPGRWPELQDLLIDTMIRFDKVFRKRIRQINI